MNSTQEYCELFEHYYNKLRLITFLNNNGNIDELYLFQCCDFTRVCNNTFCDNYDIETYENALLEEYENASLEQYENTLSEQYGNALSKPPDQTFV